MWNPFSRPAPTDQDRALAQQLLVTAQRLLGSTSSGPSSSTPSPSGRPSRIRTAADVTISSRARHLELEWEERRARLPKAVRDPDPIPADQQSSGKAASGGFAAMTDGSDRTVEALASVNAP